MLRRLLKWLSSLTRSDTQEVDNTCACDPQKAMDILDLITQNCVPDEWVGVNSDVVSREDYTTKTYHLFELAETDGEYVREIEPFRDGNLSERVTLMQRVQNPFQLGRFLVRREQRKHRGLSIKEARYYHPLKNESQLLTALEYNLDVRRYGDACSEQMLGGNNPCFYRTPREAYDAILNNCHYILVCTIFNDEEEQSVTFKTRDTEYMPVYVVKLVSEG